MSVYAYTRVSTQEQSQHGVSLDAQEEKIRQYCLLHGLSISALFREQGVSATIPFNQRPQGKKVAKAAGQGDHIVAVKLDRLFRDAGDALEQSRKWERKGVTVHLIDFGGSSFASSSAMGRFFLSVVAAFAELESNLISERTVSALQFCKNNRRVYTGDVFGFDKQGFDLVPNPTELAVVKRIKADIDKGYSRSSIAQTLNQEGVPTKNKKRWYHNTIKSIMGNWESLYAGVIE